jgi:hypothetical protein
MADKNSLQEQLVKVTAERDELKARVQQLESTIQAQANQIQKLQSKLISSESHSSGKHVRSKTEDESSLPAVQPRSPVTNNKPNSTFSSMHSLGSQAKLSNNDVRKLRIKPPDSADSNASTPDLSVLRSFDKLSSPVTSPTLASPNTLKFHSSEKLSPQLNPISLPAASPLKVASSSSLTSPTDQSHKKKLGHSKRSDFLRQSSGLSLIDTPTEKPPSPTKTPKEPSFPILRDPASYSIRVVSARPKFSGKDKDVVVVVLSIVDSEGKCHFKIEKRHEDFFEFEQQVLFIFQSFSLTLH